MAALRVLKRLIIVSCKISVGAIENVNAVYTNARSGKAGRLRLGRNVFSKAAGVWFDGGCFRCVPGDALATLRLSIERIVLREAERSASRQVSAVDGRP